MTNAHSPSRRAFLKKSAGVAAIAAFPTIIPSSVLGANAPSNQLIGASVGVGGMGTGNLKNILGKRGVRMISVCDVYQSNANRAKGLVDKRYGNKDCKIVNDFREISNDPGIDFVIQSCPDHWHAAISIDCLRNGKDMYGEKPLTRYLREGRALVDTCDRYGRIWQTGSWQRSKSNFHRACELVQNGRIGKILTVEVGLPNGSPGGNATPQTPPKELDWDFWCGPAPWNPYRKDMFIFKWRWNLDYGGGQLMDWVGHHIDIAHWGMGKDTTGPVSVKPINVNYPTSGLWNAPTSYKCECTYADGIRFTVANKSQCKYSQGTTWYGSDGWIHVDRRRLIASDPKILQSVIGPEEKHLYKSNDHMQNFVDCCRSRKKTITQPEYAHRSASVGHLCMTALELGRTIKWNPDKEEVIDDTSASGMLSRNYRAPWSL